MQLSQKNQKLAIAAAGALAAALVIRRKLRTKIRAAFDIGSGEHKLVVAAVNGTSVKVLHSEVSTVLLAQDLTRPGGDGAQRGRAQELLEQGHRRRRPGELMSAFPG